MDTTRHQAETLIVIIICALTGVFTATYLNKTKLPANSASGNSSLVVLPIEPTLTAIPTEKPLPQIKITSEISSDGKKKVILKITPNDDGTKTATVSTKDETEKSATTIYSQTLQNGTTITIPYNTWSPDNKYFFIQENSSDGITIKVFTAQGKPFANEEPYIDLTGTFKLHNTAHNFQEATGWASETLIIINTTTPNNQQGPSYWFEVPSKAIIPLSTLFL